MARKYNYKKAIATGLVGAMVLSFTACGEADSKNTDLASATNAAQELDTENNTEKLDQAIENASTEATNFEEEPYVEGELNINNDLSVSERVDELYRDYEDYWNYRGLDKNDITNILYVLNEKTTDSEGNAIIKTEEELNKVISNIKEIVMPSNLIKKAEKIRRVKDGKDDEKILEEYDYNMPEIPLISRLLDLNKGGAEFTASKLDEYQTEIEYQRVLMNDDEYDLESMDEFIRVIERYDSESSEVGDQNTDDHSHLWLLSYSKKKALNLDGTMKPDDEHWVYDEYGYQLAKVSKTDEERKREDIIEEYKNKYGDSFNSVMSELEEDKTEGLTIDNQYILDSYNYDWMNEELASIIVNYLIDESQMAYRKQEEIAYNHQWQIEKEFKDVMSKTSSLNSAPKIYYFRYKTDSKNC